MFVEIRNVRIAAQKPQQLINDRLEMHLLRRHERKAFRQIEPHLMTENAPRAGAGAVAFRHAFVENALEQIEILSHA